MYTNGSLPILVLGGKIIRFVGRLIRSFFAPSDSIMFGGVTGGIEILDPSGSQIWEILINSDSLCLHHDFGCPT